MNSPLSRLRLVAQRRQADTPEKRQIAAQQQEQLIAAQETLHKRVDGAAVSGLSQTKAKDRFTFLTHIFAPEADTAEVRYIADEIGKREDDSATLYSLDRIGYNTVTGYVGSVSRQDDSGELYNAGRSQNMTYGLLDPGEEEEAYTLQIEDAVLDRRNNFLARLCRERGQDETEEDAEAFRVELMCRALLRGYRSKQRFAALLQQHTQYPAPDLTTAVYGMKCMDGDSQELTYMESLSRWLPELIPVASDLLTTYDDLRRVEIAATGDVVSLMASYPKRGELIEVLARRIVNAYTTIPNVKAVAKAFRKDEKTITAFLKERGVYQSQGGARKKRDY
jgi:hypothetical protein